MIGKATTKLVSKYTVRYTSTDHYEVEVEATTPDEAIWKADKLVLDAPDAYLVTSEGIDFSDIELSDEV